MGSWRVTVTDHRRERGGRPQGRPEGPPARRDGWEVHGRGELSCVDATGRVLPDGTLMVLDAGVLRAVGQELDDAVLGELHPLAPDERPRFRHASAAHRTTGSSSTDPRSPPYPIR
ncbi:hypothetical protein ACWC9T_25585 [Kitasatospora sp. NPDC001159]